MTVTASSILCLAGLHFLWQGAAIAAVAWLVGAVARRFSAQAQYLVLVAGLTAMPVAFVGTVIWLAANEPASIAVVAQPLVVAADEPRPLFLLDGTAAPTTKVAPLWQQLSPWLATAYWLAVAGLSLRLLFGLAGARRLARESASVSDERLLQFVADQCALLGIRTVPLVAYCRDVAVPTVIGVLRPTILLPLAASTGLTSQELETILTHELVHIRRHDQLLVLWQRVVEILFFFQPAVWLLSRRISDVREHCCDDRVISLGIEPELYVESLLRAAELSLFGPHVKPTSALAVALSAVDQPSKLRERIMRLVDRPAPAPLKLRPVALVVGLGLLLLTLATPFALQTLAQKPAQPAERTPDWLLEQARVDEQINKINALIQRKLTADGHVQNTAANPHEFIRRIYLELTGRPPTPEELRIWTEQFTGQLAERVQTDPIELRTEVRNFAGDSLLIVTDRRPGMQVMDHRSELGSQFDLIVTGRTTGAVWGTDVYTDDSDLGTAAVHAGLVKPGEQAAVTLTIVKSPARHIGSPRNGVRSLDYGRFGGSFMLHKTPEGPRPEEVRSSPGRNNADQTESTHRRPRTTAGEMNQAIGVWENLVREKQAEARSQAARADAALAEQELVQARLRLRRLIETNPETDFDLTEIHRTKNTDCRNCHTVLSQSHGPAGGSDWAEGVNPFPSRNRSLSGGPVTTATQFRGKLGRQFHVEVVGSESGPIWGTDIYTDDSYIPTAAVHMGLVRPGERAIVTVTMVESPETYAASERHGVESNSWGSHPAGYILTKKSAAAFTRVRPPSPATAVDFSGKLGKRFDVEVIGSTEGSVWGTDVYTDDSNIATAAVHAGLVKPGERAIVTLTIVESPDEHSASTRHGVRTFPFGTFNSSFILHRKPDDATTKEPASNYPRPQDPPAEQGALIPPLADPSTAVPPFKGVQFLEHLFQPTR